MNNQNEHIPCSMEQLVIMVCAKLDVLSKKWNKEQIDDLIMMTFNSEWIRRPNTTLEMVEDEIEENILLLEQQWEEEGLEEETEYIIGPMIIDDEDEDAELIGLKVKADIMACYPTHFYDRVKIGTCTLYVFNDEEANIYLAADAHSQRLSDMICNVALTEDDAERYHIMEYGHLVWAKEEIAYRDGGKEKAVLVAGKVAILEDVCFEENEKLSEEELSQMFLLLAKKINKIMGVHFLLTDVHAYGQNHPDKHAYDGDVSEDGETDSIRFYWEEIVPSLQGILDQAGFTKTGQDGHILKI